MSIYRSGRSAPTHSYSGFSSGSITLKHPRRQRAGKSQCKHRRRALKQKRKMQTRHRQDDLPGMGSVESVFDEFFRPEDPTTLDDYLNGLATPPPDEVIEYDIRVLPLPQSNSVESSYLHSEYQPEQLEHLTMGDEYAHLMHNGCYDEERPRNTLIRNEYVAALTSSISTFVGDILRSLALYLAEKPTLLGCLVVLVSLYMMLAFCELSLALLLEPFVRFTWTNLHNALVLTESNIRALANWLLAADHVTEAYFCDFAETWCERFSSLCDRRCSFMDRELNRMRQGPGNV